MNTKYVVVLIMSVGVFIFSGKKIYDKVSQYLYPNNLTSYTESKQTSRNLSVTENTNQQSDVLNSTQPQTQSHASDTKISTQNTSTTSLNEIKKYKITIRYENKKAKTVKLTGSFYLWKEREMKKVSNGVWEENLILNDKGIYKYYFIVDGKKVFDPKARKSNDGKFSIFEVK